MIKAQHHWFYTRLFNLYVPYNLKTDFHEVKISGTWTKKNIPTLLVGNHVSWWDGFWALYLNNIFLKKRFHAMMLEEQLQKNKVLNKIGAYSIKPHSKEIFESIEYTRELLTNNNNAVLIFPQGKIHSFHNTNIHFSKGLTRILELKNEVQVLFFATFVDYLSNRKPTLYIYLKEDMNASNPDKTEDAYRLFFNESVQQQASLCK
jgi:1-acyl-sn-glycerol-3-phosphate acyltransferase